jgi:hypothetical protein
LECHAEQAVLRVEGRRDNVDCRVDEVHGALGIDQIVPADVGRVAGLAGDLHDAADAVEHSPRDRHGADGDAVPDTPEVTRRPLTVSLPLVTADAGRAVATETTRAVTATNSAAASRAFMVLPGS